LSDPQILPIFGEARDRVFESVGLKGDEALRLAVEAMIGQAFRELPTYPSWYPLGARIAEGISTLRRVLEGDGWVRSVSKRGLDGVLHLGSGRFIALHNTCERTGLNKALPRFISARSRVATKSLRDDLQGDLFDVLEDSVHPAHRSPDDELTLHLCVFIDFDGDDSGDQFLNARAELIIGGTCSNLGFTSYKYRVPILVGDAGVGASATPDFGSDEGAVEEVFTIRKRT
jgi:hypothetical protein